MPREGGTMEFKIKVRADFTMTRAQLYSHVKSWLELHAHTAVSHGFEIVEMDDVKWEDT